MVRTKTTINLDIKLKEQLEKLVKDGKIASLTEGINLAINNYVKSIKRKEYAKAMEEASKDSSFMERTLKVQSEFEYL